ncbi:peroxisomal 2,4-dienoyl-CoA reductase [Artemisia annua]|uniref:Peroxisomal 2,4-dienoyl-CoA reductase n=1 Tax=Artemisia annua TaxID=35608 RepID=A0A2U1LGZ7_ARTAN|nr:peroxisomal 2,4-dienoyl-CoA reductase [Artemisia annua]
MVKHIGDSITRWCIFHVAFIRSYDLMKLSGLVGLALRRAGRTDDTGGLILNISATLHYTASWYQIHVSAAKAVVDAITRNLALEWGADYDI